MPNGLDFEGIIPNIDAELRDCIVGLLQIYGKVDLRRPHFGKLTGITLVELDRDFTYPKFNDILVRNIERERFIKVPEINVA